MEKFTTFNKDNKNNDGKEGKEKSKWEILNKAGRMLIMSAALAIFAPEYGKAEAKSIQTELSPKNTIEKIEKNISVAKSLEKTILASVEKSGRKGTLKLTGIEGIPNEMNIKRLTLVSGDTVEVGYDKSNKPLFLTYMSKDGGYSVYDKDVDGLFDRLIIDKTKRSPEYKKGINGLDFFTSMDHLAEEAELMASVKKSMINPIETDNRKIVDKVSKKDGSYFLDTVDFESGKYRKDIVGFPANNFINGIQEGFVENLKSVVEQDKSTPQVNHNR